VQRWRWQQRRAVAVEAAAAAAAAAAAQQQRSAAAAVAAQWTRQRQRSGSDFDEDAPDAHPRGIRIRNGIPPGRAQVYHVRLPGDIARGGNQTGCGRIRARTCRV